MIEEWLMQNLWLVIIITVWEFVWKGIALWKAARNESKPWFIVLLLVNTAGILPIFYIFILSRNPEKT